MFQSGDLVSYQFTPMKQRQTTPQEQAKHPEFGNWITEPGEEVTIKGVIAPTTTLYIPVKLADGEVRPVLYADLTFGKQKGNQVKVSFKGKLPDWKGVKKDKEGIYREVIIPGKPITVRGISLLSGLLIPIKLTGDTPHPVQIAYEKLTFEKKEGK